MRRGALSYSQVQKKAAVTLPWKLVEFWAAPLLIGCLVVLFYLPPIVMHNASIQWDAADVHYPLQHYFAQRIRIGLPFWTPYVFSGYPILANPEMQAWYLPNWPLYLAGFRPGSVEVELALHAFWACLGAYLFLRRLELRSSAAMLGGLAYGLSGFFAGHSSHVPVFLSAAWFPWILWAYRRAIDLPGTGKIAIGALVSGGLILAGYYQMTMICALALFGLALGDIFSGRCRPVRAAVVCAGMLVGGLALAAIQVLPAAELIAQSAPNPPASSGEILRLRAAATLLYPDAAGTISNRDQGLVTDHYLYAGWTILPLVLIGAIRARRKPHVFVLAGVAIWYSLGPHAGLYRLCRSLPGHTAAGPPDLGWFPAALALAWLAAMGSDTLFRRFPVIGILLVGILFADLWYWNLWRNPPAFARNSFDTLYGQAEQRAGLTLAAPLLPLTRFDAPLPPRGVGPILSSLDLKFETTYGYLVLQPRFYSKYHAAAAHNRKLLDGLNVSRSVDAATRRLVDNPNFLTRAYFPRQVTDAADENGSLGALKTADPAVGSTVFGPHAPIVQDGSAVAFIASYDEQSYAIHYTAASPSLLKLCEPWYPGWTASVDGSAVPVLRVDYALMGAVVPAGEHVMEFRFHSTWFTTGMVISLLALIAVCVLVLELPALSRTPRPPLPG